MANPSQGIGTSNTSQTPVTEGQLRQLLESEKTPENIQRVEEAFRAALRTLSAEDFNELLASIEDSNARRFYMYCRY